MKAVILKCRPESRFHFGKVGLDPNSSLNDTSEIIHSDTIFSALINIAAQIGGSPAANSLGDLFDKCWVRISSGFYCLQNGEDYVYFLPKPEYYTLKTDGSYKSHARTRFISSEVWASGYLQDEWVDNGIQKYQHDQFAAFDWEMPTGLENSFSFFKTMTAPRVHARKQDQEDSFYFLTSLTINPSGNRVDNSPDVHFYFLMDLKNSDEEHPGFSILETVLKLLPDTGLGGERTGGCGLFEGIEIRDFEFQDFNSTHWATLSLALPDENDPASLSSFLNFKTVIRGGRETSTDGKLNHIRMIAEGALVTETETGSIVNISNKPGTNYWRHGKPLCLPVHPKTLLSAENKKLKNHGEAGL